MEPDPDDPVAMERRKKTMGCRKEIESLRGRLNELTAHVAGGKVGLKRLGLTHISDLWINKLTEWVYVCLFCNSILQALSCETFTPLSLLNLAITYL